MPVPDGLAVSKLAAERDGDLWVIRGKGKWGTIAIWLDPGRGYVCTRMEHETTPDDWEVPDKKLSSFKTGGLYRPRSTYLAITDRVTVEKVAEADGITYPAAFTHESVERYANGETTRFVTTLLFP